MSVRMAVAMVGLLLGCQRALDESGPTPEQARDDATLRRHMQHGFDLLRATQLLVIGGRLDAAKALARTIGAVPEAAGVEGWAGVAPVRERARALGEAATIDAACHGVARLAAACAGCHRDTGASPRFAPAPPPPPDASTVDARMARHRWATDRLWEAMIGGTDAPWRAGLEVLAAEPLPWSGLAGERVVHAQRLRDRAAAALTAAGDRATTYGELLEACAACHADPSGLAAR